MKPFALSDFVKPARKRKPRAPEALVIASQTAVTLTLPYPPSANRYWRHGNGRTYTSPEARAYKWQVAMRAAQHQIKPLAGEVSLALMVFRPQKSGDLSNRIKVLEDALIGVAYADDAQVQNIIAARFEDKANPRVEVQVTPVRPASAVPAAVGERGGKP